MLSRLERTQTREARRLILDQWAPNRRVLVVLAQASSVHVVKEDSVAHLREKIVEALISSRLRSHAIRGYDFTAR